MKIPRKPLVVAACFGTIRLLAFVVLFAQQSTDAQWQLTYLPLWFSDFPLSLVYHWLPVPVPEALIGPLWWFTLPLFLWYLGSFLRHRSPKVASPNSREQPGT